MPAHLLFLFLLIIICYFHIVSGGKLVSCHQSSNESLLSSCRLLAGDWRKTWKMKANSHSDHQMTASSQAHVSMTVQTTTPGLQNQKHNQTQIYRAINLDRKMISPGGTGSSSKLTSFPNLWARMALWYCCRRREVEYSNTAEQMLILWSKRKKDLLQEIHCFQSLFRLYSFVYIFLTFKYHTHDKFW